MTQIRIRHMSVYECVNYFIDFITLFKLFPDKYADERNVETIYNYYVHKLKQINTIKVKFVYKMDQFNLFKMVVILNNSRFPDFTL